MQALTPALAAILKSKFGAGADGFRGRIEVDAAATSSSISVVQNGTILGFQPTFTWPLGAPGVGNMLLGFTVQRTDWSVANTCDDWTWVDGGASGVVGDVGLYGSELLAKYPSDAGDLATAQWLGATIRAHMVEISGASAIETVVWTPGLHDLDGTTGDHVMTSPDITVSGPGLILGLMSFGVDVPPLTFTAVAPATTLSYGDFTGGNGPLSWLGYREVTTAGTYSLSVTRNGDPGGDLAHRPLSWLVIFVAEGGTPASYQPKRISIDKSLRVTADQATVELANEDLALGWGPTSVFVTNSRIRVYQWFGDLANEVLTFTGIIDAVKDGRDVPTVALACRDMMALLIDQTFGATAPQAAGETGAVRTMANGVYLSMEASAIVDDILDRAGWPTADRAITATSYTLDEYIIPDGQSWAGAIIGDDRLGGLVGYDAWSDELGVFHFAPSFTAGSLTEPETPAYTFRSGEDITSLSDALDQYDLRTRVKVRGPLTTVSLTDTWREQWRTKKISKPVGIWYDPTDSANIRVLDRGTKRLYKLRQSDRVVLSSVNIGAVITYPLGVSGDPSDATIYWILNGPWLWGSGTSQMVKVRKSDNHVLARYNLDTDHWSSIKVSGAYIYVANLTDDRVYRRSKTTGAAVDSFRHTYNSVAQSNPSGVMIDGTTINVFWSNSGTTARFLQCAESAPGTVAKVVKTAGTALVGGEMDTTTHLHCWGGSDTLGIVAKFTLLEETSQTTEVYAEVVDTDLEDELGGLAQGEPREHDTHPTDADHAFEIRRDTVDITAVVSLAQATQTAMRRLDMLAHRRRVLDAGIIGNPALQKTDFVRVEDPLTGIADDWTIDTYRSEMSAEGTYLGTLALLPVVQPGDTPTDDGDATE